MTVISAPESTRAVEEVETLESGAEIETSITGAGGSKFLLYLYFIAILF